MSMTDVQRQAFNERLASAIDEAQAALRPLFDTVNGAGVYHLPTAEQELLHETMFKLGMLRVVIIHGDEVAQQVHGRWLDVQAVRRRARCKLDASSMMGPRSGRTVRGKGGSD
jgi:hypothetical protein